MSVTQEDIDMIDYFLIGRGDITRWSSWENRKPIITEQYPELIAAMDAVDVAEKTLDRIAHSIIDEF